MADHSTLAFSTLHKAKSDSGLFANLPGSPEGIGDMFYATDTMALYIADTAATGWDIVGTDAISSEDILFLALIGI